MPVFQYDQAIRTAFPTLIAGVIQLGQVNNMPNGALTEAYLAEQKILAEKLVPTQPTDIPALNAWRVAMRTFNVDPTQYRSACESLYRRLTKKGDVPPINPLVDIGNLVSLRYQVPVAVIDLDAITDGIRVHFAAGTEPFTILHGDVATEETPEVGEVVFTDAAGAVHARRWCWRQSNASAVRETTTRALVVVEAHHPDAATTINQALDDLQTLISAYVLAGEVRAAVMLADQRVF